LLRQAYVADFVFDGWIMVEVKSVRIMAAQHLAQTVN